MTERLKKLIDFLNKAFPQKEQTFFTRNLVGDSMTEIYDHDGITVDLCCYWGYIEVFGLTYDEKEALKKEGFHKDASSEKQVQEIEAVKKRLEQDRETVKEAIALINSHTLYKKVKDEYSYGKYRYVLATEEMFKADYLGEPASRYSQKGISFKWDDRNGRYDLGVMEVNGHTYYDIRWALNNYERMIEDKQTRIANLNSAIEDYKEELEDLHKNFPTLKQAVTEWMEYQESSKEEGESDE